MTLEDALETLCDDEYIAKDGTIVRAIEVTLYNHRVKPLTEFPDRVQMAFRDMLGAGVKNHIYQLIPVVTCPDCEGAGMLTHNSVGVYECLMCDGTGRTE